jgi:hypothetical protein
LEIDFNIAPNVILASHITGVFDVNRSTILANDDFSIVSEWAKSIKQLGLQGIIFHNNFSDATCALHQNEHIHFIKIGYDNKFNPNVYRYLLYAQFLKKCRSFLQNVFCTDISDVQVLNNPFLQKEFLSNPDFIFCGDEPKILDNEWMHLHAQHLREQIPDYATYESRYKNHPLLNCGVIGGSIEVMYSFIYSLSQIHEQYNTDNKTAYTGDMGAFNYLLRTQYLNRVKHGKPVNTVFKKYEIDASCWFKHK